jgi:hypothetical protein
MKRSACAALRLAIAGAAPGFRGRKYVALRLTARAK